MTRVNIDLNSPTPPFCAGTPRSRCRTPSHGVQDPQQQRPRTPSVSHIGSAPLRAAAAPVFRSLSAGGKHATRASPSSPRPLLRVQKVGRSTLHGYRSTSASGCATASSRRSRAASASLDQRSLHARPADASHRLTPMDTTCLSEERPEEPERTTDGVALKRTNLSGGLPSSPLFAPVKEKRCKLSSKRSNDRETVSMTVALVKYRPKTPTPMPTAMAMRCRMLDPAGSTRGGCCRRRRDAQDPRAAVFGCA
ncbi:hypothetical protein DFH06DRAFT_1338245 [Mycena polygramma]|nr:hypothetical protein DFH06DRAFT_1338245 [Mycena polygramma]